jgi:hypothetical protein
VGQANNEEVNGMVPRSRVWQLALLVVVAGLGMAYAQAQRKSVITYPVGYRKWAHVKTMVVFSKEHKLFDRFGGLHNIYVNDIGWPALQQGKVYPDGSMFAFELYDVRTYQGAIEVTQRKFLAVMRKSAKLYPQTGGWGFEVFQGYQATGSLKDMKQCFDCHAAQKRTDFIFSTYME